MHLTNRILDSLPQAEHDLLRPILVVAELRVGQVLYENSSVIDTAYFPIDAVVSMVVPLSTGEAVEAAMIGHDGVAGGGAVLNGALSLNRAVVQLEGKAVKCSVAALKKKLPRCPELHSLLIAHEHALFAQAQQAAACNASHGVPSRLARWLLRARDLAGSDSFLLTQDDLGEILGVRRTTVSLVAHTLQEAGLIKYRRGKIHITKADGLKEAACECYGVVRLHYDGLRRAPSIPNT